MSKQENARLNEDSFTKERTELRGISRQTLQKETVRRANNLKMILLYSNASLIRNKIIDGYVCNFCPEKFEDPKHLKAHSIKEHSNIHALQMPNSCQYLIKVDITDLQCKICKKRLAKLTDFTEHLKTLHNKTVTDISQIIPFKFDTEELQCAICETKYYSFKVLQEHMHNHFRNYICEVCGTGFITKRLRDNHKRRHDDGEFKCDHCDKTFACEQKKRNHEQRMHLGLKKRNKCKFCEERFEDYWTKMRHMINEHGAPPITFKCTACDRTFANQRSLSRHVKKDHLLERKHFCDVCGMEFYLKHNLVEHMRVHAGVKNFQCHICEKHYASNKSLRQHLRSHADDRRFACVTCGIGFVQKCTLKSHLRAKHGQ